MTPIVANGIVAVPESSHQKSSPPDSLSTGAGHRSPQRASATESMPSTQKLQEEMPQAAMDQAPSTEVFAVYGVEPEIQAYAMAKYSRSALSMKESLREINSQKAEKFLNTFYFQYGHRSIADLAHIALAV